MTGAAGAAGAQGARPLAGIAFIVAAIAIMTAQDAALKWLTVGYATMQILALRGIVTVMGAVVVCTLNGGWRAAQTRRPGAHFVRGVLNFMTITLFVTAVSHLPLADVMAIVMASPLVTLSLCALLLGERVPARRWAACLVGFAGVLVMLRPGGGALNIGGLAALGAALTYSLMAIQVRRLTETETTGSLVLYSSIVVLLASASLAPLQWVTPAPDDVALMLLAGACVSLGHYWLVLGYARASPSVLAPFDYTALVWGLLLGWWIFDDVPDAPMLLGALTVTLAGLYVLADQAAEARRGAASVA